MALFLSTYVNKVDAKGRISVPAQFRAAIGNSGFQGIFCLKSHNLDAIEGFSYERMEKIIEASDDYELFSEDHEDMVTSMFSNVVPLQFDSTGRIMLPKDLAAEIGITDKAAFVGQGRKFQIWSPEKLEAHKKESLERFRKKKLTISLKSNPKKEL